MFRNLFAASVLTSVLYIWDGVDKRQKHIYSYIFFFIFWFLAQTFLTACPNKEEFLSDGIFAEEAMATDRQIHQAFELCKTHMKLGKEAFNRAQEVCLLFPTEDLRNKSKDFFVSVIAYSIYNKDYRALVVGLISVLITHGFNVYDNWCKMEKHLHEAEIHFKIAEEYLVFLEENGQKPDRGKNLSLVG